MEQHFSYTLYELNAMVRQTLSDALSDAYWVQAELSDVHCNASGHCYLELVQKDPKNHTFLAKARGVIWNSVFQLLKPYFEEETGQAFVSGIKVLVKVTITFHELYGYSLTVIDIDPSYTLGDLVARRREILSRLEEEGVLTLNKELPLPRLVQRIAVISSATAAGYGDFCNQLLQNNRGFVFYLRLFPAVMQGERIEESIIQSLNAIYANAAQWDVVVIIRGGGATSDLSGFETYTLANNCAQFPLPIITGIGHERDDTVIDSVAHTRVKTPTAAAEYLIEHMARTADEVETFIDLLVRSTHIRMEQERLRLDRNRNGLSVAMRVRILREKQRLHLATQRFGSSFPLRFATERHRLHALAQLLHTIPTLMLSVERHRYDLLVRRLQVAFPLRLSHERYRLKLLQQQAMSASPRHLLERGYALVLHRGKIVKDPAILAKGDNIEVCVAKGSFHAEVKDENSLK